MSYRKGDDDNEDEEDDNEADGIEWMNIIFLPFHPVFRLAILISVLIRIVMSSIEALYPLMYCSDVLDSNIYIFIIKYLDEYFCDIIYSIDTLLHICHRLADVSRRREYPPKSKLYILFDVISLLPIHRLLTSELCPPIQLWPNVLSMLDIIIVYRIKDYFSLSTTHSFWNLVAGYTLLMLVFANFTSCLFILVTYRKLYGTGVGDLMDWRKKLFTKMNETDMEAARYMNAVFLVLSYCLRDLSSDTKPSNITTYYIVSLFMLITFTIYTYVAYPKAFAEAWLRLRRSFEFFPRVQKIIAETQRRSQIPGAHVDVRNFYNLVWRKRGGITNTPEIILEFPRHLRLDIKKDLTWPIFYHSPTLRRVSLPFIHWLCDLTHLDFKLPQEVFYSSPHSRSHLFYLKSGIVQLISAEDGTTPLLSMTSGTIFGDINFYLPPTTPKTVIIRCLTYCEIYFFTRSDILKALHKFPEDRKQIMARIQSKIKHARTLYTCKQHVRGLDRAEDEGLGWVKRRWWELNEAISNWKYASRKTDNLFVVPPEEAVYHCSKYIGQLVLCPDAQLKTQSMFANSQFPWILLPDSTFIIIWERIVKFTVVLVLILYPPHLPLSIKPDYFRNFQAWTNIVYTADVCLSLLTAIEEQGHLLASFASVMFKRCKSLTFILNLLTTIWLEDIVIIIGKPELYSICQFNRLIKVYVVFFKGNAVQDVRSDPHLYVYPPMFLYLSFTYVTGYFVLSLTKIVPTLSIRYFFGHSLCGEDDVCDASPFKMFTAALTWTFRDLYVKAWPDTLEELSVRVVTDYLSLILAAYCGGRMIAVIYFRNLNTANYLFFATQLKHRLKFQNIHPELWKRLVKYVRCYWRHNRNLEMTDTSLLRHEPYDVYWKAHGEIATKIIMICKAFVGANPAFIKELAHIAKFTILPKNSTILLAGVTVKDVCWLVNGVIFKEYQTESGMVTEQIYGPDDRLVSCSAVFFGKPSLVTCTSLTECEMLCISTVDFFRIINQYPMERTYIRSCTEKFKALFNDLIKVNMTIRTEYNWNEIDKPSKEKENLIKRPGKAVSTSNWRHPLSKFTKYWMAVRAVLIVISIITSALQGGALAAHRRVLIVIIVTCDCFTVLDIFVKCCAAYYDERGILIYSKLKCFAHYFTRGLILDVVALVPWYMLPALSASAHISKDIGLIIYAISKYGRLHLFLGYFDYLADTPMACVTQILLLKWQIFTILLMFSTSHYLILECVKYEWNENFDLVGISKREGCWLPTFIQFDQSPTPEQMDLLIGQSFSVAQCAFLRISYGLFNVIENDMILGVVLYSLTVIYWCVFCYSVAILTLSRRGSTIFQHAFSSLTKFLNAERLDDELINRSLAHFSYWWIRTSGINIYDNFIHKRVTSMFRQDVIHFFYKQTFAGLAILLKSSEQMMKQLPCVGLNLHLLPNCPVMREMDLNPWVFIVHRGEVAITLEGKPLALLKKGSIFGQLEGMGHRPVRVSAHTTDYTDVVRIPVAAFQENIDDKARFNIHRNPTAAMDYMQVKDPPKENPYNSIKYLLRGGKSIQLPWMEHPVKAHLTRKYVFWLGFVWLVGPYISAAIVLILNTLPLEIVHQLLAVLIILDVVHFAHFVSEFYTVELVIIDDECTHRHVKMRKFKEWQTYVDIVSLILPMRTLFNNNWGYQLARLLRLRSFYDFYKYFCKDFKSHAFHNLVDFAVISLIVHAMVCGWVVIACRPSVLDNSYYIPKPVPNLDQYQRYYNEWVDPDIRGEGCKTVVFEKQTRTYGNHSFLVPMRWMDDYAIALGFIMSLSTRTNCGNYAAITRREMYFECLVCYICHFLCIWISSSAIREMYLTYRELLNFDYHTANLFSYLKHNGLNQSLLKRVKEYAALLWQRQRGNWMPELVLEAPLCLREDLYMALYSYHLYDIPLFRAQPVYFIRQLATRLHRVVICAGREMIQEGDVFACIYFIHDGEVEKWATDASGERKMVALLTTNGFFGLTPGLFPDTPVQYTFVTRTVVDMVFLRNRDWKDLLEGYPDIKRDLYAAARHLKKDLGKP